MRWDAKYSAEKLQLFSRRSPVSTVISSTFKIMRVVKMLPFEPIDRAKNSGCLVYADALLRRYYVLKVTVTLYT
jgi:hypothetical protein